MYAPIRRFIKTEQAVYSPEVILYDNICFDENGNVIDPDHMYPFVNISGYLNQINSGDYRPSRLIKQGEVEINNVIYNKYIKQDWNYISQVYYNDNIEMSGITYQFYFLIRKNTPFYESSKASIHGITALDAIIMQSSDNQTIYQSVTGSAKCQFIVDFYKNTLLEPGLYVEYERNVAPQIYSGHNPPIFSSMSEYLNQCMLTEYLPDIYHCIKLNLIDNVDLNNVNYNVYQEQFYGPNGYGNSDTYHILIPSNTVFTPEMQAIVSGEKYIIQGYKGIWDNHVGYSIPRDVHQKYFLVAYVE